MRLRATGCLHPFQILLKIGILIFSSKISAVDGFLGSG